MVTHPGRGCLRSNETTWDEEHLWRTYVMLADLESVFRRLKGELGLRPAFYLWNILVRGKLMIVKSVFCWLLNLG